MFHLKEKQQQQQKQILARAQSLKSRVKGLRSALKTVLLKKNKKKKKEMTNNLLVMVLNYVSCIHNLN